ncbi:AraC family transcriptional regulator [Nocardia sp. 852002-20019_SCH5090214]|jgi:aquaporin Z|uniref:AraC family transcriptional regulator n=1 Tax=Nocardia nova TaxID=37330 RepID=A0A2S5ZXU7_9NOCA|nr:MULTISPECIES: aquaporin [Nocardia]MBV7704447.1 aquaporin [Nocardia nova]MDN2500301.1 AraC family transcriptional regulator [Nocardia nova]OBA45900.1 AraC family transcriptional regulator [Nocardia sp. 852002-20019_SCH5090214]PPI89570.1 AraC family transcriptional regulator [Nocardia nova]PPJ04645.1 AraC family transcriptional regulator [Nocardia nova]
MSPTAQEVLENVVEQREVPLARKLVAEVIGTFVLVFGGVGTAVFAGSRVGVLGIALAFGFSLSLLVYAIGPISGAHVNPAVTIGQLAMGRISWLTAVYYWVAQLVGGFIAGAVIFGIARNLPSYNRASDGLAANGWGAHSPSAVHVRGPMATLTQDGYGLAAAVTVEVILTALLVFVVLASTDRISHVGMAGLGIGITLAVINLIAIPIDNASANPARSLAVAPYQNGALPQVWVFVVFPLLGGLLGALVYSALFGRTRHLAD